ncbi:tetratricopeptide repeat protein [Rhodanobacter sp. L36]|uniref:YfgM family protein n=1 Tax=Rhodanobacter sp. L36 TaxID=1747221 RepID=UPI00131C5386|nr:tetratricopeptide repeat protein [Rhodanobacter sp. L36]
MALDEYDKYEQSEIVQKWLRENGLSIVVGIAIGLVGIFGWQQWRNHQARHEGEAAQLYQQVQVMLASGKPDAAAELTARLTKDYDTSPYAVFAMSAQARQQLQDKQLDKAETSLGWAEVHASDPALKSLSQMRLAQVQLQHGNASVALSTLDRIPAADFKGLAQELRGDVLVKLGRADDARKAYQTALSALGADAPQRGALQMKLDDLATAGKQGA